MSAPIESRGGMPRRSEFFVDRTAEIDRFRAAVEQRGPLLFVLNGPEGIGKSTLAVEIAHRFAERFPDGALYFHCHGSELSEPVGVGEIAASLLRQLDVAEDRIPAQEQDRLIQLRREVSGRELVLLLDDVATREQVEGLLAEAPGCAVLVTSRHKLAGLREKGFEHLRLGLLDEADADQLLRRIGSVRELAEPVLRQVRGVCGGWPIALTLAGCRLADVDEDPHEFAAEFARVELAALEVDGRNPAEHCLDLTYHRLDAEQARAYALLAVVPGHDVEPRIAAAVLGVDEPDAAKLLRHLADRYLLERRAHGRFGYHGLIRAHAREAARVAFPPEELRRVVEQARSWRWRRAVALDEAVNRRPHPIGAEQDYAEIAPAADGKLTPHAEFALEWRNFLAAMHERSGPQDRLGRVFPLALWSFGWQTGRCAELIDAAGHALAQASEPGERWQLLRDLAALHERLGEVAAGLSCLDQAVQTGYAPGLQSIHDWRGQLLERSGDLDGAEQAFLASWEAVPAMAEHEQDRARALLRMHLGRIRRKKGEPERSEVDSAAALAYFAEHAEPVNVALAARDRGLALVRLDRRAEGLPLVEQAYRGFREAGISDAAADTAEALAELAADAEQARSWRDAAAELRQQRG